MSTVNTHMKGEGERNRVTLCTMSRWCILIDEHDAVSLLAVRTVETSTIGNKVFIHTEERINVSPFTARVNTVVERGVERRDIVTSLTNSFWWHPMTDWFIYYSFILMRQWKWHRNSLSLSRSATVSSILITLCAFCKFNYILIKWVSKEESAYETVKITPPVNGWRFTRMRDTHTCTSTEAHIKHKSQLLMQIECAERRSEKKSPSS